MNLIEKMRDGFGFTWKNSKKQVFVRVQAGISGGGSLPSHVDKFFEVRFSCIFS